MQTTRAGVVPGAHAPVFLGDFAEIVRFSRLHLRKDLHNCAELCTKVAGPREPLTKDFEKMEKEKMAKPIHEAALVGFQQGTESYERGRPDYPHAAIESLAEALGLAVGRVVVDLGAGTGKFTRLLSDRGAEVVAIEPVLGMREKLVAQGLAVRVLDGTAEALPLAGEAVDAVVCAQAFHWFDGEKALAEIHRALRPGGKLGLIWNVRDESCDWVAALTAIVDPHEGNAPRYRTGAWRAAFAKTTLFSPLVATEFRHVHRGPREMVIDRVMSVSFIAALPPSEGDEVRRQVSALLDAHPALRGREEIAFPYRTEVFWCERR